MKPMTLAWLFGANLCAITKAPLFVAAFLVGAVLTELIALRETLEKKEQSND